ncbi:hypothetical protein [Actinokineospora sp.]|uniref:hypothetical protein n=1 Tax=Actinokineospora sp. TaxID=1872133 RepID=UPI003D6B2F6F
MGQGVGLVGEHDPRQHRGIGPVADRGRLGGHQVERVGIQDRADRRCHLVAVLLGGGEDGLGVGDQPQSRFGVQAGGARRQRGRDEVRRRRRAVPVEPGQGVRPGGPPDGQLPHEHRGLHAQRGQQYAHVVRQWLPCGEPRQEPDTVHAVLGEEWSAPAVDVAEGLPVPFGQQWCEDLDGTFEEEIGQVDVGNAAAAEILDLG